jgi:hypothetical protein
MFERYIRGWVESVDAGIPCILPLSAVVAVESYFCDDDMPFCVVVNWTGTNNQLHDNSIHRVASSADLLYPVEWKIAVDWLEQERKRLSADRSRKIQAPCDPQEDDL